MDLNGRTVLVCDCEGSMELDGAGLAKACGATGPAMVNHQLCRAQIDNFRAALGKGRPLLVACTQEAPLFDEIRAEADDAPPTAYVNIREQAGWSEAGSAALPKMAALLAAAAVDLPPTPTVALKSDGICLVYGRDESAVEAARQIAGRLSPTVLLRQPGDFEAPRIMDVPVFRGRISGVRGHLGAFELTVDDYAPASPSSRGHLRFEPVRNGAATQCDLILDLTGDTPLFPAADRRDGYFRPDPGNPAAVQKALFDMVDLVGEFEKPRYVAFRAELCAHARSRKTGCTRCLDVCPAGAIAPDGDHVAIDPYVCGGCGSCHSVCPTGAAAYALPAADALLVRLRTLLGTYAEAGGREPVLLLHDARRGEELIAMLARHGRGLPANVLPFTLNQATQVGFDLLSVAFAYGAARVLVLASPEQRNELAGLAAQIGVTEAVLAGLGFGSGRTGLMVESDPDKVEDALWNLVPAAAPRPGSFLPMAEKRSLIRAAIEHLHSVAPERPEVIRLPAGAPFGAITVRTAGCTLCLACVGACPTKAIGDNPDKPQITFREEACIQCGLCRNTCPEHVITLQPRFSFREDVRRAVVLKEEEPFACIRCGKPFGARSSIERIVAQLADKHPMFREPRMIRTIQMCSDCRVIAQIEDEQHPMAGAPRPLPRTAEDYESGDPGQPKDPRPNRGRSH